MTNPANKKSIEALPSNVDAERTILGAVMLDNAAWTQVREGLRPDDFSLDSHRRIALRIDGLLKRDTPVDLVTLAHELNARHEIQAVGGVAYIASLTEGLPRRPVIEEYVKIVKDKSLRRGLMSLSDAASSRAQDQSEPSLEIIADMQGVLDKMTSGVTASTSGPVVHFIADAMRADLSEYHNRTPRYIPSGIAWFDQKTRGGYRMGRITLICARPGVGKTSLGLMSIAHNCLRGRKGVVFSLEMEKEDVLRDLIPYVVDVPNFIVNNPEFRNPEQHSLIQHAYSQILDNWDLSIYDEEMDIDKICWTMDRETKEEGREVLFVLDHFGLIAGGDKNPIERDTHHSGRLRAKIKTKKNAALINLMQFRKARNMEEAIRAPTGQDVKGAGRIYEDAFACLIIHREINEETRKMSTDVLLDIAKLRRGGTTGSTRGKFDTRRLAFEAEPEPESEDWYG